MTARYVWPDINKNVTLWARTCQQCQRSKVQRHTKTPLSTFSNPDVRFDHVHIDIVGPLPSSGGYSYLLTCVDRYTRWPEAFPLTRITADTVAKAFVGGWISRFGTPSIITTDRGRQFESSLWASLMQLLGSKRCRTTAYHPSANGMVERLHRQLKSSLKALPDPNKWSEALPLILLGIRSSFKTDLQCCTAELVYGTTLRLPGEFFSPTLAVELADPADHVTQLKLLMSKLKPTPVRKQTARDTHAPDELSTCTHVFIRQDRVLTPLQQPYNGPYKVVQRFPKYYKVEVKGKTETITLDRLKAAHLEPDPTNTSSLPSPQPHTDSPSLNTPPTSNSTLPTRPIITTRSGRRVHWPVRYRT